MGTRRRLGFLLAAALGAAVALLPAIAGSETGPTVNAENIGGIYGETHRWAPPVVMVASGAVVTLSNLTEVRHGVHWVYGPAAPSCSGGVPVGTTEESAAAKWSGTCTLTQPGSYTFYCTVHGSAMQATITVSPSGTTTTTPTQATTEGAGQGTTTSTTSGQPGSGPALGSAGQLGSPLAGSASAAVKLPPTQRGRSVRGSVAISQAGAGGRLEVDLLSRSASLARAGHPPLVRVGVLVRTSLRAGRVSFTIPLNARAKAALLRRRRLALNVKVMVKGAGGSSVTVTRAVVVHS